MAKAPRKYATLGPFVFSHPHLSSPDTEGTYADNKYKVDGVGDPKAAPMVEAQQVLKDVLKEFGLPSKGTTLPLKKEEVKDDNGNKTETGKLLLRTKSKFAPTIVDASGNPIPDAALKKLKIGAGSEGFVQGYFASYKTTKEVEDAEGNTKIVERNGVNFTLTGVQLIKLVKGSSGANFAAYEGGGFTFEGAPDDSSGADGLDLDGSDDADDDGDDGGLDI